MPASNELDDADRVVQIVLDAVHYGAEKSAELNNCSKSTVSRYRTRVASDPELAAKYAALFIQFNRDALARQREQKEKVLNALTDAVLQNQDPHRIDAATRAFKAIADSFLAENIALGLSSHAPVKLPSEEARIKKSGRRNNESAEASRPGESLRETSKRDTVIVIPGSSKTQ